MPRARRDEHLHSSHMCPPTPQALRTEPKVWPASTADPLSRAAPPRHGNAVISVERVMLDRTREIRGPALGLTRVDVHPVQLRLGVLILALDRAYLSHKENMLAVIRPMEIPLLRLVASHLPRRLL